MPIYLVTIQGEQPKTKLVDASTKAAAINHVIRDHVSAAPLSAREVVAHMTAGLKVETVTTQPKENTNEPVS